MQEEGQEGEDSAQDHSPHHPLPLRGEGGNAVLLGKQLKAWAVCWEESHTHSETAPLTSRLRRDDICTSSSLIL